MIKLIVSDLDGTLLTDDHITTTDENREAIRWAREQGAKFAIASGRTAALMEKTIEDVGGVDFLVMSNGSGIMDVETCKEQGIFLEFSQLKDLVELHDRYGAVYEVYANGAAYIRRDLYDRYDSDLIDKDFVEFLKSKLNIIESYDVLHDAKIEKVNTLSVDLDLFADMWKELRDMEGVVVTSSLKGNMEVSACGADKGTAVKKLAEYMGITKDEVLVFGDGLNDKTMMEYAGHSYAMENAIDELKEVAEYVGKRYDENAVADGIYRAMKK